MAGLAHLTITPILLAGALTAAAATVPIHDGAQITPPKPSIPNGFMYWGTADTTLDATQPDSDFGGSDTLTLTPGTRSILVRYEQLLPVLGGPFYDIQDAQLTLHAVDMPKKPVDPSQIKVYLVRTSWNEGGKDGEPNYWAATYNSRYHSQSGNGIAWKKTGAQGKNERTLIREAKVTCIPASNTVTITGLEKSITHFLARNYENFGWLITWEGAKTSDSSISFHSREATDPTLRPALSITSEPFTPPEYSIDAGVAYIERYPEYFSWKDINSYEQKQFRGIDVGIMKEPEFNDVPKNPEPGDMLQYVGVVKNHGSNQIEGFGYSWKINDTTVQTGIYRQVLLPEKQAYLWLSNPAPTNWSDHRDEWITLRIEPMKKKGRGNWTFDPVKENKNNNELTIFTKARAAGIHADETTRKFYRENYNAFGTYSFEDWIQFQMQYWNQIYFPKSRFKGLYPDGALPRVRVQRIQWFRDGDLQGPVHIAFDWRDPRYDGMWGWDLAYSKPEDLKKSDCFFRCTLRMCEPSLMHEMSHQCFGLMDIYWMTMEPATDSATGKGGKVSLKDPRDQSKYLTNIGYWPKNGGLMGGGDSRYTDQHEGTGLYSDHSVYALNANAPYRGGFFGDYLYGLQTNVVVTVLDESGKPVAGATLLGYQSSYGIGDGIIADDKQIFTGVLNKRGEFRLPNQPTGEKGPVTVATGHTLRDNPFGRIHVCGVNGNMLLRLEYNNTYYYHMLTAWELNVAFANGQRDSYNLVWTLGPDSQIDTYKHVR